MVRLHPFLVAVALGAACGDGADAPGRPDAAVAAPDAPPGAPDAAPGVADAAAIPDAAPIPDAAAPNISEVLDCGDGPPPGPGNSNQLQRHAVDLGRFPHAICNDGSGAVFFFRPYVGEENRDRWLINLNGGGGCANGQPCADRWCWCRSKEGPDGCPYAVETTNFSRENMNSDTRASAVGEGITLRGDATRPNPIGDYNQVRVVYCSSDYWTGTRRAVLLDALHPKTGQPVQYTIHFLGARILEAALATLRADGVPSPTYTFGAAPRAMPDLDDAVEVILSGDSAGGAGVISQLDRVAARLRAANTRCGGGGACPLAVRGLVDAVVGPALDRLDYSTTIYAAEGYDTYAEVMAFVEAGPDARHGAVRDESCLSFHGANDDMCSDTSHIVRHHVTTPFFVRMALLDGLISSGYVDAMYSDPELGLMTVPRFAVILQRELAAFPMLPATAEEGAAMTVAPGVFAPACRKHDTIHDNAEVYEVTITPAGASALSLFEVFEPWRSGGPGPKAVLTQSMTRDDTVCRD
jgi:hypothetical protein